MKLSTRLALMVMAFWGIGGAELALADEKPEGAPTKLMSVNVGWMKSGGGWQKRQPVLIETIKKYDPDIIGFQEPQLVQRQALAKDLPRYQTWHNVKGRAPEGKQEGSPIFFRKDRYKVDTDESKRFWLSDTPEVVGSKTWDNKFIRICEVIRLVDIKSGKGLYIYNSHWSFSRNAANLKGAQLILDRIAARRHNDPVVLMGDFNANVEDDSIRLVTGGHAKVSLQDCFRSLHPDTKQKGTFHDYTGNATGHQIDYIFIDPKRTAIIEAEIVRDHREGLYPSDHFPLRATVRFK